MTIADDIYAGFDDSSSPLSETTGPSPVRDVGSTRGLITTSRSSSALRTGRLGTAVTRSPLTANVFGGGEEAGRPVTAVKGAGYVGTNSVQGRNQRSGGLLSRHKDLSPSEQITALEVQVHELLEAAADSLKQGQLDEGAM
jgi:hypothetical protein